MITADTASWLQDELAESSTCGGLELSDELGLPQCQPSQDLQLLIDLVLLLPAPETGLSTCKALIIDILLFFFLSLLPRI